MLVERVDDLNVRIVNDPEHAQKHRGQFVLLPSSVRVDVRHTLTLGPTERPSVKRFEGKTLAGTRVFEHHDDKPRVHEKHTRTKCLHCRANTETGLRGGCSQCGKVKWTADGKRVLLRGDD